MEDKHNERVLRWTNNQAPIVGLAQEQRHVHMTFEGASIRIEVNFCSCSWSIK